MWITQDDISSSSLKWRNVQDRGLWLRGWELLVGLSVLREMQAGYVWFVFVGLRWLVMNCRCPSSLYPLGRHMQYYG